MIRSAPSRRAAIAPHRPTVPTRHEYAGRVLEHVIEVGSGRAAQLQHVAEALRRHKGGPCALLLPQRIGDDGGRMCEQADIRRGHTVAMRSHLQRGQHPLREIAGCGRGLGDADTAGDIVDERNIREGAPDIDADAPRHAVRSHTRVEIRRVET